MLLIWNWIDACLNVLVSIANMQIYYFDTHKWMYFDFANNITLWIVCINSSTHSTHCTIHLCFPVSALGLWFFIRRGKQCLDFTVTVHLFHMIFCWMYNSHPPAVLSWWLVNAACIALMAVIGEYLCMRTELRAIPVNSGPKSNLWILCWQ